MENYRDLGKFSIFLLIILLTLYMALGLTEISIRSISTTPVVSLNLGHIQAAEGKDKGIEKITTQPRYTKDSPSTCYPDYPTMCLSSALTQIDCEQLKVGGKPYRNFEVLEPDSLGLDPDRDGIGCEVQ